MVCNRKLGEGELGLSTQGVGERLMEQNVSMSVSRAGQRCQ